MKRVGLVTFFSGNFGSMLQAYSTKSYIDSNGYKCTVLSEIVVKEKRIFNSLLKINRVAMDTIRYPEFLKNYLQLRKSSKKLENNLGMISKIKMDEFVQKELQPFEVDYDMLKVMARSEEYIGFFSGSDQIWNGSAPANKFFFLDFAPNNKRVALATSFGVHRIESYNIKKIKKYAEKYNKITVREKQGQKILKDLIGENVECLADPVLLKSEDEWRKFAIKSKLKIDGKYVFCFFINQPNDIAVSKVIELRKQGYQIVEFAYHYGDDIWNCVDEFDGSPNDFVNLIDKSEYVLTDSFHAVMFSIILNRNFFVFDRMYTHTHKQKSRIENVLGKYHYEDRLIEDNNANLSNFTLHNCNEIVSGERDKLKLFINEIIEQWDSNHNSKIREEYDCVGCGACAAVCSQNAISPIKNDFGYDTYVIDYNKCINCGRCENVCKYKHIVDKEKCTAYVAYNEDDETRKKSASGGVFSCIATEFLREGGCVFGACLSNDSKKVYHKRVEAIEELPSILGSKYVESDISSVLMDVKQQLIVGRKVLFCGTSCQVNAIYSFLKGTCIDNLYTIDLICHGVPGKYFFEEYIEHLGKKYRSKIENLSFREKTDNDITFNITFNTNKEGKRKCITIPVEESMYYYMFMRGESYRKSCYQCEYASANKPADITLGDYLELKNDYPEIISELGNIFDVSSVLSRTTKGKDMINNCELYLKEIELDKVVMSHQQLIKPSSYSSMRNTILKIYNHYGIKGLCLCFAGYKSCMKWMKKIIKVIRR